MIREPRSREELLSYYDRFVTDGVIDDNVHPWVAEAWKESRRRNVTPGRIDIGKRVGSDKLDALRRKHSKACDYLGRLIEPMTEFFRKYELCLLLVDSDCVVIKNYALPYFGVLAEEMEGVRVGMNEIGASSISISREHGEPFWMHGAEMWTTECRDGEACSVPVFFNGETEYILTAVSLRKSGLPEDAIMAMMQMMRNGLEVHLAGLAAIEADEALLDATPFAVYHVMPDGEVAYANKLGLSRLANIGAHKDEERTPNLNDVVLNYRHTPIFKGFAGIPSHNKEVTWITRAKTYEDITTVVPMTRDGKSEVASVVVVSMPIEDLRTLVAHAAGYTAKYSLDSMVGDCKSFCSMKDKAARVARNGNHVLLQGESGTGKQRLAHGIHQASQRAAGPLITLRCAHLTPEMMEQELFGIATSAEVSYPGRLELASGGTLFLDEVEKMPKGIASRLAGCLSSGKSTRKNENVERPIDVRIIAACDADLRRLTERKLFDASLYEIVSKSVIRVPPLRTRREDIPRLIEHMVGELAQQHQMKPKKVSAEAVEYLAGYDWPDNIKQLQSVLEYAFFNTQRSTIEKGDVSLLGDVRPDSNWKNDREIFVRAWKAAGGNVSRLANLLGVSRVTLYRYLKKFGMEKT